MLENEVQHGVSFIARLIVGNPLSLGAWYGAIHQYHFQTKTHRGGKNAADHILQDEALKLARQGVRRFYLISNDGGFASTACFLRFQGCQVIGFGNYHAARQFQASCDVFSALGADPDKIATTLAVLNQKARGFAHSKGGTMGPFSSSPLDALSLPDTEKTREALQAVYGSAKQPPLLTNILSLFLQHTFTALCLTEQDNDFPRQWSAGEDAEILTTGTRDPIISVILEQDVSLRNTWHSVKAFAWRCNEAYQQGRAAARHAFPYFPRSHLNALQQEHLATLLKTWRYNPHAASPEAQPSYPGYVPETEQCVLQRWFRRGYFFGAQDPRDTQRDCSKQTEK